MYSPHHIHHTVTERKERSKSGQVKLKHLKGDEQAQLHQTLLHEYHPSLALEAHIAKVKMEVRRELGNELVGLVNVLHGLPRSIQRQSLPKERAT